jgi:glycosyltransferase involved in cell wall biosynthesis
LSRDVILLVGQGHWTQSLAKGLSETGLKVEVATLDSLRDALTPATWKLVASAGLVVRIGFRPGAKTWRGLAFDTAMRVFTRKSATTCCYWIGTDVMQFAKNAGKGERVAAWRSPAFSVDQHIAGSEPLLRELEEAGIGATVVGFPGVAVKAPAVLPPLPKEFTVATYVPDARSDFYGGHTLLEAARRLPQVRFEVMGGLGSWAGDVPPNVHFLGWVSDPSEFYARSSCVIRLPDHDSIGGTAVEGLLFGRPVIYTQDLNYAEKVDATADAVVAAIQRLLDRHEQGMLEPQEQAAAWARNEFDHVRRFAELASHLQSLVDSDSPRQPRLTYLTLQATAEGQAAHAHVHEIVKGLAESGWCVRLIEPDYGRRPPSIARRLGQFARIEVSALWGLRRGDAFYIRDHFAAYPAALSARLLGVPVIQEVNGSHEEVIMAWPGLRRVRKAVARLSRSQLRMADAVIAVTPQLVNWVAEDAGVAGAHLVSNGADITRFHPGIAAPEGLPDRYAVFFGALAPWQGIDVAIEATRLEDWPDDVALLVVGDGMLREEVELSADGIRVVYLGRRPYGEIASIVGNSIASLIPKASVAHGRANNAPSRGHWETGLAPLKLFESMACGVPVVASDLPGLAETVSAAGCGVLVEPGNPTAIAQAIATLATSPDLAKAMGDKGRESAVREHSWKSRADDTAAVLRSIGVRAPR